MNNPLKPNFKTEFLPLLLIAICAAASFYFYAHFPERVITHWNYYNEPDGWSGRGLAAFLLPAVFVAMYLLLLFLPLLDPKKERYGEFKQAYNIFKNAIITVMAVIYFASGLFNLGYKVNIGLVTGGAIGILFIILGNYFGKLKSNWFIGIRTPWTLSSEEVWNKTHRFGGKIFMLCGVFLIIMGVSPSKLGVYLFVPLMIAALLSIIVYSYLIYRRQKNIKN